MASAPRPARAVPALLLTAVTLLLSLVAIAGTASPAQAADGYKYWNYFHVEGGKYVFATTGPADFKPEDGSVEAYRYGLSSSADGLPPRTEATTYTAEAICKGTEKESGQKLVGVLLDYGTTEDADGGTPPEPKAACAAVPADANGQDVLSAVADVRADQGLTCGIDGYPVKGCSVTVKNPPAPATEQAVDFALPKAATPEKASSSSSDAAEQSDDGGFPWTLVVVVVVIVVLAAGGLVLARRNRTA